MVFGQGTHQYTVQEDWWTLPEGWEFGWIPAVALTQGQSLCLRSDGNLLILERNVKRTSLNLTCMLITKG